jgi:hypothetical protein
MRDFLVVVLLIVPFAAIAALVCWLVVTIGRETSKGK